MLRNLLRRSPANRLIAGTPHIGLLASQIIAETATGDQGPGLLYDEALTQTGKQMRVKVTSWNGTAGTLFVHENGSILIEGQADGAYTIGYDWEAWAANGTLTTGSDTASVQIGPQSAAAPGTTVTGSGTISGGAATGQGNATASGATVIGTGTVSAGSASGEQNATAPGAAVIGAGSVLPGSASGGVAGDASASGAGVTGSGSVSGGAATGEQSATAPGVIVIGTSAVAGGQAHGDLDAIAPGAILTGTGGVFAGVAWDSSAPEQMRASLFVTARQATRLGGAYSPVNTLLQEVDLSNTYYKGGAVRLHVRVAGEADADFDPSSLSLKTRFDSGAVTVMAYGIDPEIVRDRIGRYHADLDLLSAGTFHYRWETSAPNGAAEGKIPVAAGRFD